VISVESQLAAMTRVQPPSLIKDVFVGLQHVRYLVGPGQGRPLALELAARINYAVHKTFINAVNDSRIFFLRHSLEPVAIMIEELAHPFAEFPRLSSLCFQVHDLAPIRSALAQANVRYCEIFKGIETELLPGLGDRFVYTTATDLALLQHEPFNGAHLWNEIVESASDTPLAFIEELDHIAYRIQRADVETVSRLLMTITPYRFDACYSVDGQQAETIVFRLGEQKPALVASYGWDETSVVQQYVHKYSGRVHHLAWYSPKVRSLVQFQMDRGIPFTTEEMIGDEKNGILQIFTHPSPYNHEITEYIERFRGYRGFFDPGNVAALMGSTKVFSATD
jgi:4-hydroxyphenylpyruvate dioxygenase-like putative hemolysin